VCVCNESAQYVSHMSLITVIHLFVMYLHFLRSNFQDSEETCKQRNLWKYKKMSVF